ncbi:hypothetical protein FS842_001574 [Serendipita sp. 407]|nr:hypothetical protein FS842_001574 [Serendipita sp. 407]
MPAKKTRRSSLFSRQRPSLPSPSPSTLPIGLDPLVNRSAISGRLVHRDDGISLEGGGIGQQYQESREGQEAQRQGHEEHRSINLSTHSLGLGSKSNSSSQHIPIPIPNGDASLREMEEVGRFRDIEEGQFVPTASLPNPVPTSDLSPTLILAPVSDPAPAPAPAISSVRITLPPRIEQERQRSAMRTRIPRNKTRRETSLLRKAWNRLTCQPTLPASPIDGHRNPFDRSASSSSSSSSSTRLFSSSVPTTTPHHIPLKPSISNPSTGSPTAFTTTTTTTTAAATTPSSSQYPPSSPSSPPPLHSPTFSIQQQQQHHQHNRLHRRPHSSPPPRHRQPQPQPQPQLSV